MLRNGSLRPIMAVFSSFALLVFLGGCSSKKNPKGPLYTGSVKRLTPAQLGKNKAQRLPLKASPLVNNAARLAKSFKKNPADARVAMSYIHHLRSLGMQQRAVNVLFRAYQANPNNPVIASEYGRLLLGTGKTLQAQRILKRVVSKSKPDWHTLSALGTIEARNGNYEKATQYYRQARALAPKRASILNNLALAMALDGKPDEAENLLRNADDSGRFGARLRQNLALVLALQGKYDEAQAMATTDLPPEKARQNIAYLKRMLSTTDASTGIELSDETVPPVARATDNPSGSGPTTTASINKIQPEKLQPEPLPPVQLTPKAQ